MPCSVRPGELTRGVFLSPFPQEGYDVAVAVTSQGVRCAGIILMPGMEWGVAYDVLTLVLERVDPPERWGEQTPKPASHLSLIRPDPADVEDLSESPATAVSPSDGDGCLTLVAVAVADSDDAQSSRLPA